MINVLTMQAGDSGNKIFFFSFLFAILCSVGIILSFMFQGQQENSFLRRGKKQMEFPQI